ncbi:MAG: VanW family protein [Candidatus Shapirobacteria bacterium]
MKNKKLIIIAILIVLIPLILLFLPIILNYDKTGSNTFILDKNYSHLSREQIDKKIDQDFKIPQTIVLKTDKKDYSLNTASISAQINKNRTTSTILYRRLNEGIFQYIKYFFVAKKFTLDISYDDSSLNKYLDDLSSQTDKPFVPSELQIKSKSIVFTKGELGQELDKGLLKQDIISSLSNGLFDKAVNVTLTSVGYFPNETEVNNTKAKAEKLIGKSLILTNDINKITVDDKTLISWLDFKDTFQVKRIDEFTKNTAQSLKHDPVNAVFKFENGKVLDFQPSVLGVIPKESELSDLIKSSMTKLIDSEDKSITASIPVTNIEPLVKNDDVNTLGIKELLGRGVSTFNHSDATRNMNVQKGSEIVNRILVAPGETFSFIKNLGEVSLDAGFKKAYIIRQGKTELDVGGGVCQVSTTLFRAMLDSGLDITARQNHAYRVSYYEENSKPGFDATVFIPNPDLKFINDTAHYVLIQNIFDLPNRTLTYEIYGTSDGRKATISNYRQWDAQPAPPDVNIDDPTLPLGKVIQDEKRIPGLKTAFDWTVTDKDGKAIHQKTFQSVFTPWAAVFRHGTKI